MANKPLEMILQAYPRPYITDTELSCMLDSTSNSRYSKVKRLLAQEKLQHIRRGLYCLTEKAGYTKKAHPYELAQYIYGPSYISLESALSFHGLIPEAVYTVTSATSKRSSEFQTPLGLFIFLHLPLENFFTEVQLIEENGYSFFMAKPWKAICDFVFCYKKNWKTLQPLFTSLRLNAAHLPPLKPEEMERLDDYYQHTRINRFLKGIQPELLNIELFYAGEDQT